MADDDEVVCVMIYAVVVMNLRVSIRGCCEEKRKDKETNKRCGFYNAWKRKTKKQRMSIDRRECRQCVYRIVRIERGRCQEQQHEQ